MTEFLRGIEELFDIFCNDQKQLRKREEINLKMKVTLRFMKIKWVLEKENVWMLLNQSISLI